VLSGDKYEKGGGNVREKKKEEKRDRNRKRVKYMSKAEN
jgi:hypothetical protein